jgi:pimeloyl-ACP methyl ester carboxylesterase
VSGARTTLVLVHGAWHGPWCWDLLLPQLRSAILDVRCLSLPSAGSAVPTGLADDARHLGESLRRIPGPLVLCGHSYGGTVISEADLDQAQVRRLVYLCAYLPEPGESVDSSLRAAGERRPGHWIRRLSDGHTRVDAERAAELFYGDCPPATQDWAIARLRPHWGRVLTEPAGHADRRRHASTYVVCDADRALAPAIQRNVYAPRAQQVVTLASGHSPFLSLPRQLARLLADLAG